MDQKIIVCVSKHMRHTDDAQESTCDSCGIGVWCQSWNMKEKKVCLSCVSKIKDPTFMVKPEDLIRARQEIEKMNK